MFSSPKPTPRRVPRLPRDSISISSHRDHVQGGGTPSVRSSRLGQHPYGRGGSPTSSAGESVRTYREEGRGDRESFWGRDERHGVAPVGNLPGEVQRLIKGIDLLAEPVHGHLDRESGFAFVSTQEGCIAWNYTKRTHSPTCYNFPAPPHDYTSNPVLAALYTSTSEPGMILISPTGELRFWESMSLALANVDRFQSTQLDLGNDLVEKIQKCNENTFIITSNTSSAWRLTIVSSGGRLIPNVVPFTRPGGIFGRASSMIFGGRSALDRTGINGVASASGNGYLMSKRSIQKWALASDGGVRFAQEFDLYDTVGAALFGEDETWASGGIGLELNDLVAFGNDELAVLVSYTGSSSSSFRSHNSHAIVLFTIHPKSNTLMVSRVVNVSYLAHPDPRMIDVPRLYVPHGSTIAFIHFSNVIVFVSLADGAPYEEVIVLKDPSNAFLGVGCQLLPSKNKGTPCLVTMPAAGGIMSIEVDNNAGRVMALSPQASATTRLKSKMEQAVFFGDRSDNPLSFDLPAGFQGDAAEAAEAVSAEIVASTSVYMSPISELRPQLSDRLLRLKELISFIRKNGLISILPQSTRQRLSRDAEKIRAGIDLWDYQNRLMDARPNTPQSLLSDAIAKHMGETDDDFVRGFFRKQLQNLHRLLEAVFILFRSVSAPDLTPWVIEANRIFMIVTKAAARFRDTEVSTYEVNKLKPVEQVWTASLIDAMEFLFHTTERLIRERTRDLGSAIDESGSSPQQVTQVTLKTQMADLAAALCTNMEEKIRCVVNQVEGGADPQAGMVLMQRWTEMKPKVIRPLVTIDKIREAYELAEHHSDFETLVYLCTNPISATGKIQTYIEKFGPEFAFPLYQWYIDQGQFHALLSQDEVYGALLTDFFERRSYPELAWIHHIACKRYGEAGAALLAVETGTNELAQKHLAGSIGKLAAVAEIKTRGGAQELLISLDDELDHVTIQNTLRETLVSLSSQAEPSGYRPPPSIQRIPRTSRPAFSALFDSAGQRLIDGEALGVEDLVDVLTLREDDSAIALAQLSKDKSLPEGRKQVALISIWRRVFIHDDWAKVSNTNGRSEETQRRLQRETLTYRTVKSINEMKDFPPNYILSPFTSSPPPLAAELSARFPDMSPSEVEALMKDHMDEIHVLQGLMKRGLEERVREVLELVKRDV